MTLDEMKQFKKQLGYSNKKLSEISGVPEGTVAKIFSGITAHPRYETLQALTKALINTENPPSDTNVGRESSASYGSTPLYTLNDYLNLPADGPRMELIDGVFYDMGEPTTYHQGIINYLNIEISNFITCHQGKCMTMLSPVAVQLDADNRTVVEPDLMIICDMEKFKKGRIIGAPDFIAEVLSPSTRRKDMGIKTYKYQNAGVREYWIIDPVSEKILVYDFENDIFPAIYGFEDHITVKVLPKHCDINLKIMKERLAFLKQ